MHLFHDTVPITNLNDRQTTTEITFMKKNVGKINLNAPILAQPSVAFHIETSHLFCSAKQWLVSIWNVTLAWNGLICFMQISLCLRANVIFNFITIIITSSSTIILFIINFISINAWKIHSDMQKSTNKIHAL